jgi:FixJ family two-component response regulator
LPLVLPALNKKIVGELGTSEVTVKVHSASMTRKMQVESPVDLVKMACCLGMPNTNPNGQNSSVSGIVLIHP